MESVNIDILTDESTKSVSSQQWEQKQISIASKKDRDRAASSCY